MRDESAEKLKKAKQLHDESVELFRRVHEEAMWRLKQAQTHEEFSAIVAEAVLLEREAIGIAHYWRDPGLN